MRGAGVSSRYITPVHEHFTGASVMYSVVQLSFKGSTIVNV